MKDPRTNITYHCCEQYMMAHKALLFEDETVHQMIMDSDDARKIKHLGRLVSNYDQEVWDKNKYQIVLDANLLKFTQSEWLNVLLLNGTEGKTIAEASYEDEIWGIGLSYNDDDILDESKWKGENLLGKALMETRQILLSSNGTIRSPGVQQEGQNETIPITKQPSSKHFSPYNGLYNLGDKK
jgi:ribA/ribD-fused uncharacterized protein